MLELLHIENIAIIEEAEIAFRPGFNALTGDVQSLLCSDLRRPKVLLRFPNP